MDVVVIGAGALGLSTALHLGLAGRSVLVLERDTPGAHASGRAAGLFKSVQADELRTRLARRSIDRACTFADWAGVPLPVTRSGSLAVARTDRHASMLREEIGRSRGWGVRVEDLDTDGLGARSSLYRPTGAETAWWCPEDVYVEEPMALVEAYVTACALSGVQVRERAEVVGIEVEGGAVRAVHTAGERIATAAVVDAAGAWTRPVAALAGAWVGVTPVRHQLYITEPTELVDPLDPIVRVVDSAVYLRPARGGVMVGGFEPDPLPGPPGDPDLDLAVLRRLAASVRVEVAAAGGDVAEHRGGMFTMSPDGRFVAGPVPGVTGLWVASGCNGSGFSSSLALGEALAAHLTGVPAATDIAALAPGRIGPLPDAALAAAGVWQYAHYYDPAGSPDRAG